MKFCSLYSGSSGNSIFIASDNAKVLIDAGLAGKKIDDALKHIGEGFFQHLFQPGEGLQVYLVLW